MISTDALNYIKNELRNYNYLKLRRKDLIESLIVLKHKRDGLPSPNYEGIRIENAYSVVNPLTVLDERIRTVEREKASVEQRISVIERVLSNLSVDDRADVIAVYVAKISTRDSVALSHGLTVRIFRTNIDNALSDAWETVNELTNGQD